LNIFFTAFLIGFSTVWDFEQKYADLLAEDQI